MVRAHSVVCLFFFFCIGCETNAPQVDLASSGNQSTAGREQSFENGSSLQQATIESAKGGALVTRVHLDDWIARFDDQSNWNYGERTDGELAGTWASVDGDGNRIVFGANGSFSTNFVGNMNSGLYAISDMGRIVAVATPGGSYHYWFDGKTITGPKGPNPNAQWKRTGR